MVRFNRLVVFLFLPLIGLVWFSGVAQSQVRPEKSQLPPSQNQLWETGVCQVSEYQAQIRELDVQIQAAQEDLDWLADKIQRREALLNGVPERFYTALAGKKKRVSALIATRIHLKKQLALHRARLAKIAPPKVPVAKKVPPPKADDGPKQNSGPKVFQKSSCPSSKTCPSKGRPCAKTSCPGEKEKVNAGKKDGAKNSVEVTALAGKNLGRDIRKNGLEEWLKVTSTATHLEAKTLLPILFPSASAKVAAEYAPFLKKLAAFLKERPAWIYVDGFADCDAIKTSKYPSNFELGAARAASVVHALVALGVESRYFKVISPGRNRLPEDRKMGNQKAMERYVDITLRFMGTPPAMVVEKAKAGSKG